MGSLMSLKLAGYIQKFDQIQINPNIENQFFKEILPKSIQTLETLVIN